MANNYKRKVHLFGVACGGASGGRPPTTLQASEFRQLPEHMRCRLCADKLAPLMPWTACTATLAGGVAAALTPPQ
jgi:rubredoxin